jgi:hypothetical protein
MGQGEGLKGPKIFLLSPARVGGERGRLLFRESAGFDLARRLRADGATIGETFAFISGLYFRGKLAYSERFAEPPEGLPGAFVIAAGRGLMPPATPLALEDLRQMGQVPVDLAEPRFREPFERHCRMLEEMAGPECRYVLLGSVASLKYLEPLSRIFGERLLFPPEFVGRGDMSRGGLLLRCVRAGVELEYEPLGTATRHGKRPPRLPRLLR